MTKDKIKEILKQWAEFEVICHPEHVQLEGNVLASGDYVADRRAEENVREQLENGNEWAWCNVQVKASWKGYEASDYLGCCSYSSEENFKQGGYYDDMKEQALDELVEAILTDIDNLDRLIQEVQE